jgi:D-alanyl-D-alanine carboxypeptidase/D-alanyl-D-alanine-endopeptidase (penicillin-binding protein 4)
MLKILRKNRYFFCLTLSLCSFLPHVYAQDFKAAVDNVLSASCLNDAQTAISVVELPSGKSIYSLHPDTPLMPASIMKTLTSAAALRYLSPEYRFKTHILFSGKWEGSVITGDLIVKAGGDPKLTFEHLWHIARRLRGMGIKQVTGKLVIDTQFFDNLTQAPEWGEEESSQAAYDARLSPFSMSLNTLAVHVVPGDKAGAPAQVWVEAQPPYLRIHNQAITTEEGRNSIAISREMDDPDKLLHVLVQGRVPLGTEETTAYMSIDNPTRYSAETFRVLLGQAGIEIAGPTEIGKSITPTGMLYQHISPPLTTILKELNTFSNNFIAEQVLKTIAAETSKQSGSHAEGLRLVKDFLQTAGVRVNGLKLVDGSGLSRKNRVTAQAMTDMLTVMAKQFELAPDFMSVLRAMGAKGALSKRLSQSPARAKVRAKTGTLGGTSTLTGYVSNTKNEVFAFAFLLNNNQCGYTGADMIEDQIINAIYQLTVD